MVRKWAKSPNPDQSSRRDGAALRKTWPRLHRGDCEPYPKASKAEEAWRRFHAGDFEGAVTTGLDAGGAAMNAAIKAQAIYATYLEAQEKRQVELFEEASQWAQARRSEAPRDANAHYLYAFTLGRLSQRISVAKALAQGVGGKLKEALATALALAPKHAEAHIALGAYHAEVIDKVGALVGGLTYGASRDASVQHFETALKLNPDSAIARIEYGRALLMLFGKARAAEARKLLVAAAACKPADAMEQLDVELARSELG